MKRSKIYLSILLFLLISSIRLEAQSVSCLSSYTQAVEDADEDLADCNSDCQPYPGCSRFCGSYHQYQINIAFANLLNCAESIAP